MEVFINFLIDNYIWFLVISGVLLFALIGYLVDTSKLPKEPKDKEVVPKEPKPKKEKKKKEKKDNNDGYDMPLMKDENNENK